MGRLEIIRHTVDGTHDKGGVAVSTALLLHAKRRFPTCPQWKFKAEESTIKYNDNSSLVILPSLTSELSEAKCIPYLQILVR